jgi:uncharacterized cupin superfamily protein
MGLAHWDEVDSHRAAKGEMDAVWQWLGDAAGTKGVGVNRVRVEPGNLPTPPHSHGASEEVFFILSGSGLAWQNGEVHEIRPLDCVIHTAGQFEHTLVAGPAGLEYLVFGTRHPTEIGWLPRSGAVRIGRPWVEGRTDDPWEVEANVPLLEYGKPAPRPANIVNVDEVEQEVWEGRVTESPLATFDRSKLAGLHWQRLEPGRRGAIPHCHSLEEEIFVILDGTATLELWPSPAQERAGKTVEETLLRAGHVVARPPGRRDDARLRDAGAERHLLVPALAEDLLARRRRARPRRAVRVLRRRAGRGRLMAYDEALAGRIRAILGDRVTEEKKVFGGLAFMIGGNMAVAASSNGGIIVRVDPAEGPELAATTPAELMVMRGKTMAGWLRVGAADVANDEALAPWVARGAGYADSLPPK